MAPRRALGKVTEMRKLSASVAALGLGLAVSAYALASPLQSASMQYAQAQNQQENVIRKQERQKSTTQQRSRTQQELRQRSRTVPPSPRQNVIQERSRAQQEMRERNRAIQRNQQIQTRDRVQLERRVQDRRAPQIQQRYNWQQYRPGQRPPDWRQHQRFNPGLWERNFTATNRFHWQPYRRPNGWYYRRWVFGMILPTIFWTENYWINDYWAFGLMNPPYGYVWVRYGDDALLVNVQTGLILRVVYGLFY